MALTSCKESMKGFWCVLVASALPSAAQPRARHLTYACIRSAQIQRCRVHICCTVFQPHWDGTGTVLRWGHTLNSVSPGGHIGRLGRKKRSTEGSEHHGAGHTPHTPCCTPGSTIKLPGAVCSIKQVVTYTRQSRAIGQKC